MFRVLSSKKRAGPIGMDIGTRSVKLVQFNSDRTELIDAARWDLPGDDSAAKTLSAAVVEAIRRARENRAFRGRDAVVCLTDRQLFLQNVRVPKAEGAELDRHVHQEAAKRMPFPVADAEIRYLQAADVRQAGSILREVIVLAALRSIIDQTLSVVEAAGLTPVSLDAEPLALLRGYAGQFRREEDAHQRALYVHLGHSRMAVLIAEGEEALFIKYVEVGGKHLDEAVARGLGMTTAEAAGLRRHNGDRRADQQDPEIARSIAQTIRPTVEKIINELAMCVRYHSVTFRGKPLVRVVLGGWEASPTLAEAIAARLNIKCELSQPFRRFGSHVPLQRQGQWDVAAGLALRAPERLA